jgi:hypothetical protein
VHTTNAAWHVHTKNAGVLCDQAPSIQPMHARPLTEPVRYGRNVCAPLYWHVTYG